MQTPPVQRHKRDIQQSAGNVKKPRAEKITHMISPIITFGDECSQRSHNSAGKMKKPIIFTGNFLKRERGREKQTETKKRRHICYIQIGSVHVSVNTYAPYEQLVKLCIFHGLLKTSLTGELQYVMSAETLFCPMHHNASSPSDHAPSVDGAHII